MKPIFVEVDTGRKEAESINLNQVCRYTDIGGGFVEVQFSNGDRQHVKWDYATAKEKFEAAVKDA